MFNWQRSLTKTSLLLFICSCCAPIALAQAKWEQKGSKTQRRLKAERELIKALRRRDIRSNPVKRGEAGQGGDQGRFVSIEEVRQALNKSYQASKQLSETARQLTGLSEGFASQALPAPAFRTQALDQLSSLRKLSKTIGKDQVLNILADGFEVEVDDPQPGLSRQEFRSYSDQVLWMADRIEGRIAFFYQDRDFSQVRLEEIQLPSAPSLCSGIESLSQSLLLALRKSKELPLE